jgi:exodeoxyribonuclease-3
MALRLATWNVNSLRRRLGRLARFAAEAAPDLICLHETKVADAAFPRAAVRALGYPHLLIHGKQVRGPSPPVRHLSKSTASPGEPSF